MKKKKFYLSVHGLNKLQTYLTDYKNDLERKTELFLDKLASLGEVTAFSLIGTLDDIGDVSSLIQVEHKLEPTVDGYKAIVMAFDVTKVVSSWYYRGGIESVEVSPLLMAEFGSGKEAQNPLNVANVGRGTFTPNKGHANQDYGWWWVDLDGITHHSYGITPTQPMYNAQQKMIQDYINIAKGVFK